MARFALAAERRGEGARERLDAYFDLLRTGWDAQQGALPVTGR
jgi:hypothetical protein